MKKEFVSLRGNAKQLEAKMMDWILGVKYFIIFDTWIILTWIILKDMFEKGRNTKKHNLAKTRASSKVNFLVKISIADLKRG